MSGPLYKFYTNGGIFFKLDSNVHPNWAMCRTHFTLVPALSRTLVVVRIAFSESSSLKLLFIYWIYVQYSPSHFMLSMDNDTSSIYT